MATPKLVWQAGVTGNNAKTVTVKTVVQEITLFNRSGSSLTFTIYRTNSNDSANKYQEKSRIRANIVVAAGTSVTLSNLRWTLDIGDSISFEPSNTSYAYNIFVDGVEFE